MHQILPENFDDLAAEAVQFFWSQRHPQTAPRKSSKTQGGTRGGVLAGKNMDGFFELVKAVAAHCGLPPEATKFEGREVILPGYFRATKKWDVLVMDKSRLLAAFEFKSQVGSFGNNLNNRSEEVVGSATDLWVAHRHDAYTLTRSYDGSGVVEETTPILHPDVQRDPRPPFLGWLMLLEDCKKVHAPVRCEEPHFPVFPEYRGASYAERYRLLCERLVQRRLYSATGLVLSTHAEGLRSGEHTALSPATSLRAFFGEFAGRMLAAQVPA